MTLFADPTDPLTRYLSYASMVIPSNDAFVANDDPEQVDLFDGNDLIQRRGSGAFVVTGGDVYDAGTEVNDEIPANTAALAQAQPDTGITENGLIRQHEGFQGSDRLGGPIGNVLTARPDSDFTLPGAEILSIEVAGARESTGFAISNAPQPIESLTTGQTDGEIIAEALAGNLYYNIHTLDTPSGAIRGQLAVQSDVAENGARTITLVADLDSSQEPAGTSQSDATGQGTLTIVITGSGITYTSTLSVQGISVADLMPVAGVSSIHIHNAPAGNNGPVILDIVQDAGGDVQGNATSPSVNTGDGNVFVETGLQNQGDILIGGAGNDILVGGVGDDELFGGAGNDELIGGTGNDLLAGGGGQDSIDGGAGSDTQSFQDIGIGVTVRINDDGTGTAFYAAVSETFTGIENLIGSDGDDRLTGNASANFISGGGGDDLIIGGSGDDELLGEAGNDTIVGGLGVDNISGGDGGDNLIGNGQIEVTVTNLQPGEGSLLTPVFLATQDGQYNFFNSGSSASESLERLAEDGITAGRISAAFGSGGVGDALSTPGGPIAPGESRTISLFADPNDPLTQYLSFASMVIPSNDAFVGNDSPVEIDLFDADGNLITRVGDGAFLVLGSDVYDAGTEVNDEVPENTAALAQAAPDTGVDENGVIRLHEGFQGSEAFGGPIGNVLAARPNSDFTASGAQILSIEVAELSDEGNVIAGGDGDDFIRGGDGDDVLIGDRGDDEILGGDGDDRLVGGFGADLLDGGTGDDALIGDGQIEVTVTNLQPDDGSLLTPVFLATQNGVYDIFDVGSPASASLERLTEDGITGNRITAAINSGGVNEAVATAGGPLAPGQTRTVTLFADPANPLTQYLSYASMVIPSNDAFVGNDDPLQIDLFAGGNLNRAVGDDAIIVTGDEVYDAGTEVNDEVPETTAALAQAAPDTGVTEGGVIRQHEGFQGSDRLGGPIGNVLAARPGSDFTLPGAEILQIEIDDAREQTGFQINSENQPLVSLTTDQTSAELVEQAAADSLYYNIHTSDAPSGAIRGQLILQSDLVINDIRTLVLTATLDSSQEPAGTSDSTATGTGRVTIFVDGDEVTYSSELTVDGLTTEDLMPVAGVSAIHLHNAPAGTNGPVITDIVQDAGGDRFGAASDSVADTGDGNVFVETFASQNDTLIGGDGDDTLDGGADDDVLIGGSGNASANVIDGGAGDDLIEGGGGDDALVGGDGDDLVSGGLGNDLIQGGDGNDILFGNGGDDEVFGEGGNDRLTGGGGADLLDGGDGDDIINAVTNVEDLALFPVGSLDETLLVQPSQDTESAVPFVATVDTILTLRPFGFNAAGDSGVRVVDGSFIVVSQTFNGVETVSLVAGESYMLVFEPFDEVQGFDVEATAGTQTLRLGFGNFNNPNEATDVNGDGESTSLDAMQVVNSLARMQVGGGPSDFAPQGATPQFADVNGDGRVTALDALLVINELGRRAVTAESEQFPLATSDDDSTVDDRSSIRDLVIEEFGRSESIASFDFASITVNAATADASSEASSEALGTDPRDEVFTLLGSDEALSNAIV